MEKVTINLEGKNLPCNSGLILDSRFACDCVNLIKMQKDASIPEIPERFITVRKGNITIFTKDEYKESLLKLDEKLFDEFNKKEFPDITNNALLGRGRCLSVTLKDVNVNEKIVIRRYRHGGFLGYIAGDVFWDSVRPLNELAVSDRAFKMGLSTVEVLAVIVHNFIYPFFKAEIVTKEIVNAFDLINGIKEYVAYKIRKSENDTLNNGIDALSKTVIDLFKRKKEIIREVANVVRKMHDIGIYHGDLHLKNILLKRDDDGNFHAYIIDMDKSVLHNNMDIKKRMKNLYRLDRSVEKLAVMLKNCYVPGNCHFPVNRIDRVRFFREYMRNGQNEFGDWKRIIRRGFSGYKFHKLCWHLLNNQA